MNEWGWYSVIIIVFSSFITLALFVPGTLPTYTLVRFVDSPSTVDVLATLKHSKIRIREAFQLRMREARAKSVKMNGKQLSKMEALHEVEQEIGKIKYIFSCLIFSFLLKIHISINIVLIFFILLFLFLLSNQNRFLIIILLFLCFIFHLLLFI